MSGDSKKSGARSSDHPLDLARIQEEIFTGLWADLKPHAERDAVILVSNDLDLAEVALSIALDSKEKVADWITQGAITRPAAAQLQAWSVSPDHMFRLVIVAPYVVIQDLAN